MTDDELARRLLLPLDEHPDTPSRVDITAAVATGTKRARARRPPLPAAAVAAGLAVATVPAVISRSAPPAPTATGRPSATAAPSPTAPAYERATATLPSSCAGRVLPVTKGIQSHVFAVDPTGRYATYVTYPRDGGTQLFVWHEGKVTKIGGPGNSDSLDSVNSHGVAVGDVHLYDAVPHGIVVSGGKLSLLPGGQADARAINDHGVIVGNRADKSAALRWPSRSEEPVELPVPDEYALAMANDIDADGTVVGHVENRTYSRQNPVWEQVAYVWPGNGPGRALAAPTLPGVEFSHYSARAVSNGWVLGAAFTEQGTKMIPVRWDLNTGKAQVLPELDIASDVNPYGWIVGMSKDQHAVLTDGVTTVRLPDVLPFPKKYGMNFATSVSDDGRTIVGNVDDANRAGLQQAVLWQCS
ncbi:hypothetical protein GCM10009662_33600 [Catellatospora coxensis]|uniref:hypothetical protein n=1 Tax=Catellatospora coxensis TaxID=310354 RepID=UPI0031D13170